VAIARRHLSDPEQLLWAAEHGRCLVTRDIRDFPRLSLQFEENRWPHAGVAIVPRSFRDRDVGAIVQALAGLNDLYQEGLPRYAVVYLRARGRE